MSSRRDGESRTGSDPERQQQHPSTLHGSPNQQGDRQDKDDSHGR